MTDDVPAADEGFADEYLVGRAQEGFLDAFEHLVRRHGPGAFHLSYRLVGDREAARDLAQESLVSAYRNLATFRGDAAFRTWLYRIVTNTCINHLHRSRPSEPLPDAGPLVDAAPGPAEAAIGSAQATAVRTAIASLPMPQRVALVLNEYEGLSYAEIAKITQTSVPAVRSQLFRARRSLARTLEEWR